MSQYLMAIDLIVCLSVFLFWYSNTSIRATFMPFQRNIIYHTCLMRHPLLTRMVILLALLLAVSGKSVFTVYPLGQDYFEKIYLVNHNDAEYYLTINCRQQNILSISITPFREFVEQPAFNIYGNSSHKPKISRGTYTFLQECHAYVEVNTSNFLEVKRSRQSQTIFALSQLVFAGGHNEITVHDQSTKWGLGERFQKKFHVADGRWTIWNRDKPWKIDEGRSGLSEQTYGHHPLYLARETQSKLYHLAYFKNTHGLLVESSKGSSQLTFHSIGGPVHFLIILGGKDPEKVLENYHEFIGRAHVPPFWSLGHHQCRWGYRTLADIKKVVQKYNQHDIPLDTFWSDLEYMNQKKIFTINQQTHPSGELNALIKDQQLHFVPLLDVGVSVNDQEAMRRGKELGVFFRNPQRPSEYYTGEVWPGVVHFVDYLHPNSTIFWKEQLDRLHKKVNFSGIWLDMNEPSNFRGGENLDQPFKVQQNENLNVMTISADLDHYNQKDPKTPLKHREVHAYYGHLSTVPTYEFLSEFGRPFIISRSTSVGTGHFAGHWTGDNVATWDFLRLSISGNFLFQIFGVQMVGADICGFYQNTNEELCARWHQVGAFYPFARNHNHQEAVSQQPWAFGSKLLDTSRESIKTRYALLKQLYTILIHKKGKGSFYRPIAFQFYEDQKAFEEEAIETQVLLGRSLMTTPIVYPKAEQREVYFPGAGEEWYQFQLNSHTGKVQDDKIAQFSGGSKQVILNPLPSPPPTFLRAGFMLLTNYPQNRSIKLSTQFNLFAALREDSATGSILSLENYFSETAIKQCISDSCLYELTLRKIGEQSFSLYWKYVGSKEVMGALKIKSVVIAATGKKWKSEEVININTAQGTVPFEAPLIR